MGDLEWTPELVIRLMKEYESHPELWDSSHESYRVQTLKYETWREMAIMFDCDIADLRKKLNSLFASHRREKARVRAGCRSTWFLYPHMSFLPGHVNNALNEVPKPLRPQLRELKEQMPSSDDEDVMEDVEDDEETPTVQEEVLIKEEPVYVDSKRISRRRQRPNTHKPRLTKQIKRKVQKAYHTDGTSQLDIRLGEALKLLRRSDLTRQKDECDSFGEYIADSLRKHDERTQSMIKQAINNILFEQEMKKYNVSNQYTVVLAGVDENPLILDGTEKFKVDH